MTRSLLAWHVARCFPPMEPAWHMQPYVHEVMALAMAYRMAQAQGIIR